MRIPAELWEVFEEAMRKIAEMLCDNMEDFKQSLKDIADLMERLPEDAQEYDRVQPVKSQRPGETANKTCIPSRMRRYTAATGG